MKDVKKLQKQRRFDEALAEYLNLYAGSLADGDVFASGLFMDEIVQTLLLQAGKSIGEEKLRHQLNFVLRLRLAGSNAGLVDPREQIEDDIEMAIRKRFPEQYQVQDFMGKAEQS